MKYAVTWIEATCSGDLYHQEVFDSLKEAQDWLAEAEAPEMPWGYPPSLFDHCGPREITAIAA